MTTTAPISLQTTVAKLKANGRTEEMLKKFAMMEQLGRERDVSSSTRRKLREGRWHWDDHTGEFRPIHEASTYTTFPGEVEIGNDWEAQPLRFRLRVMSSLTEVGESASVSLYRPPDPTLLPRPNRRAPMPGALIRRIELPDGRRGGANVDLSAHRAIAVRIHATSDGANPQELHPILNIQLESTRRALRDHYVDLDFTGERTLIVPRPNTERMFPNLRPNSKNYRTKRAVRGFKYDKVSALNLRWMQYPKETSQRIDLYSVEALSEREGTITHPIFRIGDDRLQIPVDLKTGDSIEYSAPYGVRVFDAQGEILHQDAVSKTAPMVKTGSNWLRFSGGGGAPVEVTVTTVGPALPKH